MLNLKKMKIFKDLKSLLECINSAGGASFIVGGAVRDHLLGKEPKDIDLEVYDIGLELLETALQASTFKVDAVGRSFGVLKVVVTEGEEPFDVALPRTENKSGQGHKGFVVDVDQKLSQKEAGARRDFTINAISYCPISEEFIDPYDGIIDLERKVLRHVGPAFAEDPLRVLRGCQFAARFDLEMCAETLVMCASLQEELSLLPKERLWEEFKKLLLKSEKPSIGLDLLQATGATNIFPELKAMLYVDQEAEYHPEGQNHPLKSLWVHFGMVVDSAVRVLRDDDIDNEETRLVVLLGALCHDLGKPATTEYIDGRCRAHNHEEMGVAPTEGFLHSIGCPLSIIEQVVPLVAQHLKPFQLYGSKASNSAIRRLAVKVPLLNLCRVARADFLGRTTELALATKDSRDVVETRWLLEKAEGLGVREKRPAPILMGRHLIELGMVPGKGMGEVIAVSFQSQLEGVFFDEVGAMLWAEEHLEKQNMGGMGMNINGEQCK